MEKFFGFNGSLIHLVLFGLFFLALYMSPSVGVSMYVIAFCLASIPLCWNKMYFDKMSFYIILFSVSYTLVLLMNTGVFNPHYLVYLSAPISFYIWGKYLVTNISNQRGLLNFFMLMLVLFAFQTYVITIEDVQESGLINPYRGMLRSGDEDVVMPATLFGLNVSLGLAGLGIFLSMQNKFRSIKGYLFLTLSLLSLLTVIHLVNRTGIVVVVLCTLCSYYYNVKSQGETFGAVWKLVFIVAIGYFIISMFSDNGFDIFEAYNNRTVKEGTSLADSGNRTWRWVDALGRLLTYPFGWNTDVNYTYTHNLWLDVAMFGGIFPFVFIVIATIKGLKQFPQLLSIRNDIIVNCIISFNVCFFLNSFVEPVIIGFDPFFYLYCMMWGMQSKYIELSKSNMIIMNE